MEHKPNNLRILMEMRPALDGVYGHKSLIEAGRVHRFARWP